MIGRILAAVIVVATAVVLAIAAWPQLFSLADAPIVAQVVSLRGAGFAIAIAAIVALGFLALVARPVRRLAGSLVIVLLVYSGVTAAVIATRGLQLDSGYSPEENDLTVLSWNTLGAAPGAETIAQLAIDSGADIVALPETREADARAVAAAMDIAGVPMRVLFVAYDTVSAARTTSLLVSDALGDYAVDESATGTAVLPTVVARSIDGTGPTIVAVHAVAPIPGEMANWRSDLDWLESTCAGENVVLAGDFNATIDHMTGRGAAPGRALGDCIDAGMVMDAAAVGTWPTSTPAQLGAPIDHVMVTADWTIAGMRVIDSLDDTGSDHRPIVVHLRRAG